MLRMRLTVSSHDISFLQRKYHQTIIAVITSSALNARKRSQHSITLKSLEDLAGSSTGYERLCDAVKEAVRRA